MRRALLFLILATGCAHAPRWSIEPQPRALLADPARDPRLVVRASGAIFSLVARRNPAGGHDAVLLSSDSGGDSFSGRQVLNAVPGEVRSHGESAPRLLLGPRSELYALWVGDEGMRLARSLDYGRSFAAPTALPLGDEPSFFAAEVSPQGVLMVAWFGDHEGATHLKMIRSTDRGASWSQPRRVTSNVCPCCRPALAADAAGRWYLSWRGVQEGQLRELFASLSTDGGESWSVPAQVARDGWKINGCPHSGPALLTSGDRLFIAWFSAGSGTGQLYWSQAPLGTTAFESRRVLSGEVRDPNHPSLAAANGQVFAAFQGRDPVLREGWGTVRVFLTELRDGVSPEALPEGSGSASYPELRSAGARNWVVAWTELAGEGTRIQYARAAQR
jgi:hypothetical protein